MSAPRPVKPESQMDDDTLIKHFNARHMPMRGLQQIIAREVGEELLRGYHRHVHRVGTEDGRDVNHEHLEP